MIQRNANNRRRQRSEVSGEPARQDLACPLPPSGPGTGRGRCSPCLAQPAGRERRDRSGLCPGLRDGFEGVPRRSLGRGRGWEAQGGCVRAPDPSCGSVCRREGGAGLAPVGIVPGCDLLQGPAESSPSRTGLQLSAPPTLSLPLPLLAFLSLPPPLLPSPPRPQPGTPSPSCTRAGAGSSDVGDLHSGCLPPTGTPCGAPLLASAGLRWPRVLAQSRLPDVAPWRFPRGEGRG